MFSPAGSGICLLVMRTLSVLLLTAGFAAHGLTAQTPDAAELAPTGTLRAAYLGLNPVQGKVDPATGKAVGVVPDLVAEIARRLKVPFTLISAPDAGQVIAHIKDHSADIGFLAYDKERAVDVDYAGAYELMFNAYIVKADAPLQKSADADRAGLKIGAVRGQTQELFLSANVKNAKMRVFDTMPPQKELERLFAAGEVDAFGVNQARADEAAAASGGKLRATPDNFLVVEQALVVSKGDAAKAAGIERVIAELRANGFVKAAVERSKVSGVAAK
jgi:polar amino acid transport system substrate-binding protein